MDGIGNAIVADSWNHRVRKITPQGRVSTLAGTGEAGHRDGDALASGAEFNGPIGVAVAGNGIVLVTDYGNRCIRCVRSDEVTPPCAPHQPPLAAATQVLLGV